MHALCGCCEALVECDRHPQIQRLAVIGCAITAILFLGLALAAYVPSTGTMAQISTQGGIALVSLGLFFGVTALFASLCTAANQPHSLGPF